MSNADKVRTCEYCSGLYRKDRGGYVHETGGCMRISMEITEPLRTNDRREVRNAVARLKDEYPGSPRGSGKVPRRKTR